MLIETIRPARFRWVAAAAVAALAGAATVAGAVPAAAGPINLVDCNVNHNALQPAIDGAAQGEALLVTGTCAGPFTITSSLTLTGVGLAVLDGNQAGPVVAVGSGAQVHLRHLAITNGTGGIANRGTLTVSDSTVTGNRSSGPGGGVNNFVNATLVLIASTVRHNFSVGAGGGINNNGSITVLASRLSRNSGDNCGGIANVGNGITATVILSSLSGNTARVADGGGICASQGSTLTLARSLVSGNSSSFGAGIYNNDSTARVIRSTVALNKASRQGGGIFNVSGGTMTLTRSAVVGNTAEGGPGSGGGIFNGGGNVSENLSQVSNNNPDNCDPPGSVPGCTG